MASSPAGILAVCTGNICRSPVMERLLAACLSSSDYSCRSAGTHALVGQPIEPPMARLLDELGADSTGFAAQRLTAGLVRSSSLVLTATREHRSAVVRVVPQALRTTYTLREFARLWTNLDERPTVDSVPALTALLSHQRGLEGATPAELDDIVDPYRGSAERFAEVFEVITAASETVLAALAAVAEGPAPRQRSGRSAR